MTESDPDAIETDVTTDNSNIRQMNHDVEAWADNGEYATLWYLTRVSDTVVSIQTVRCERGLCDQDGQADVRDVPENKATREVGRDIATDDPAEAVRQAREYWQSDAWKADP
jgi:hypothetical protein